MVQERSLAAHYHDIANPSGTSVRLHGQNGCSMYFLFHVHLAVVCIDSIKVRDEMAMGAALIIVPITKQLPETPTAVE